LRALESIGFAWMAHDSVWMDRYHELKDFKNQHGHCLVPARYQLNRTLGRWMNKQRVYKKMNKDGKCTSLSESRTKMLDDLGFSWNAKDVSHTYINARKAEAVAEACNKQITEDECSVEDVDYECNSGNMNTNTFRKESYRSEIVDKINSKNVFLNTENGEENISDSDSRMICEIGKVSGYKASTSKRRHNELSPSIASSESIQSNRKIYSDNHTRQQCATSTIKTLKQEHKSTSKNKEEKGEEHITERENASVAASISTEDYLMNSLFTPHQSASWSISNSISNSQSTSLKDIKDSLNQSVLQDNTNNAQMSNFNLIPSLPPLYQLHDQTNATNITLFPSTTDRITAYTLNQTRLNQQPVLHNLATSHSSTLPRTVYWNFSSLPDTSSYSNLSTITTRPSTQYPQMINNTYPYLNQIVGNNNRQTLRNDDSSNELNDLSDSMHNHSNL